MAPRRKASSNLLTEAETLAVMTGLRQPGRPARPARQKYGARPVTIDGVRFASQVEARRYQQLRALEQAGEIRDLLPHPRFIFEHQGVRIGAYTADSAYTIVATGERVIEDVKSGPTRTTSYRLRRKLMQAFHHIEVKEYEEGR